MKYLGLFLIFYSVFLEANIAKTEHAQIKIIGSKNIITEPGVIELGYQFNFTPGWHTYWINPGDSGGPPVFEFDELADWNIENNLWPGPQKIEYPPLMTFGYVDEVVFPFRLEIKNLKDQETEITAKFLVCDDICVPEEATLLLKLKNQILNIEERSEILEKWKNLVPIRAPPDTEIKFSNGTYTVTSPLISENSQFFPFDENTMDISSKQNPRKGSLNFSVFENFDSKLQGVISTENGFIEIEKIPDPVVTSEENTFAEIDKVEIEKIADPVVRNDVGITLLTAIFFAFLGGLILNLMPCVLPVIALKALSLVKSSAESNSSVSLNAGAYVFGVIATFMLIAFTLVSLKNAGELIGWGYQLQSPFVVTILATLIFFIGIVLVSDLNLGSSLGRLEKYVDGSGPLNSFLTGTLSVVVASPCTAPFMGAALGFALIQPDLYSYSVFFFLALGFASPYFLIALFPKLVNLLPKPGKWMQSIKQLFGFMMFGAAIWLIWVLANQVDANSLLLVLVGWFSVSFIVWLNVIKFRLAVLASLLILFGWSYQLANWEFQTKDVSIGETTTTWSIEKEKKLKENGESYFINFTAAWCITCKVNERVAFTDKVFSKFKNKNITYLKADWTNRNDEIASQIEKYNRSGIPLYIFWDKKLDEPLVLNEILTESYLMEVVDEY
tara:strand:- start:1726 stop:3738 length:2013 start_codon:yes stop_codon:yes gene_type:complete